MSSGPRTVFRGIGLSSGTDDPSTAVISRICCPGVVLVPLWAQVWGEPLPSLSIPNGISSWGFLVHLVGILSPHQGVIGDFGKGVTLEVSKGYHSYPDSCSPCLSSGFSHQSTEI